MPGLHDKLHTRLVFQRRVKTLANRLSSYISPGASVLDVGCGDGWISAEIKQQVARVSVTGIDLIVRPETHIPVIQFDGKVIPLPDASFDVVMFVDVLHHTDDPKVLLAEATRVTRKHVLLKDHFRTGFLGGPTLRFMDWVGNAHHGIPLPYNYLSPREWEDAYRAVGLKSASLETRLGLYPQPANLLFGRKLHFIALLEKK